jgi:hypothetical protein
MPPKRTSTRRSRSITKRRRRPAGKARGIVLPIPPNVAQICAAACPSRHARPWSAWSRRTAITRTIHASATRGGIDLVSLYEEPQLDPAMQACLNSMETITTDAQKECWMKKCAAGSRAVKGEDGTCGCQESTAATPAGEGLSGLCTQIICASEGASDSGIEMGGSLGLSEKGGTPTFSMGQCGCAPSGGAGFGVGGPPPPKGSFVPGAPPKFSDVRGQEFVTPPIP